MVLMTCNMYLIYVWIAESSDGNDTGLYLFHELHLNKIEEVTQKKEIHEAQTEHRVRVKQTEKNKKK